jgi:hypothetical protein
MDRELMDRDFKDDELARRLEAYADARLSPELSATSRMRAHVMDAAHRQAMLARADADRAAEDRTGATVVPFGRTDRTRASVWRRSMTALLAAGLTLVVGVGSVAASQAGGPLYDLRIWAETVTLPSEANARAQAELNRLADRLAEAAAAAAAGDSNAAQAALEAYEAIVTQATAGASGNAVASATLDTGVRNNIAVLSALVTKVPEQARDAIQHAIDRSDSAVEQLRVNPAGNPNNGLGPSANPGNPNRPDRTPNANKPTDDREKTPKPHPTPQPKPPDAAAATPRPTPKGGPPSSVPGGPPTDRGGGNRSN